MGHQGRLRGGMKACLVLLALLPCAYAQSANGNVTILGDITVTGSLRTSQIRSMSLNVDGSINVVQTISAEQLTTDEARHCPGDARGFEPHGRDPHHRPDYLIGCVRQHYSARVIFHP